MTQRSRVRNLRVFQHGSLQSEIFPGPHHVVPRYILPVLCKREQSEYLPLLSVTYATTCFIVVCYVGHEMLMVIWRLGRQPVLSTFDYKEGDSSRVAVQLRARVRQHVIGVIIPRSPVGPRSLLLLAMRMSFGRVITTTTCCTREDVLH